MQQSDYVPKSAPEYLYFSKTLSHNNRILDTGERAANISLQPKDSCDIHSDSVDFASLNKFKQSILHIDFNEHLVCFKC